MVLNKKSNISNENENSEEVNNNLSHHQHGNNFFNTPQTLTNSESKNKNKPSKGNEENIFNSFENNVSKPKKNVCDTSKMCFLKPKKTQKTRNSI